MNPHFRKTYALKEALLRDELFEINFKCSDPNEWRETLDFVKSLPNRTFDATKKIWKVPHTKYVENKLFAFGFKVNGEIARVEKKVQMESRDFSEEYKKIPIDKDVFPELRSYQIECLQFLEWRKGKGLIADEAGTGKSCESLSYLKLHPELRPALIVVNAPIKEQWKREYKRWVGPEKVHILFGRTVKKVPDASAYIINYEILTSWQDFLISKKIKIIIADEVQFISNYTSKRTKALREIFKKTQPKFIPMSGTPIKKRPAQFFTALSMVDPVNFPSHWNYLNRYCKPRNNGFTMVYDGISNAEELFFKVKPLMIRRTKEDVMKELPSRARTVVPLYVDTEYNEDWQNQISADMTQAELRARIESLKHSAYIFKEKSCINWIKNKLEEIEKLVVFAYHTSVVESLHLEFKDCSRKIYGQTSQKERAQSIDEFINSDKINLLIMNIQSGGVGIDGLQKVCDTAAFVEFAWSAADHDQAESRLHRMGQQNPVNIFYLIGPGTIDEHLMEIVDESIKNFSMVIEGKQASEDNLLLKLQKKATKGVL